MSIIDKCYCCLFRALEHSWLKDDAVEAAAAFLPFVLFVNLFLLAFTMAIFWPAVRFLNVGREEFYALAIGTLILSYLRYCRRQKGRAIAEQLVKKIPPKEGIVLGRILFIEVISSPLLIAFYFLLR